MKEIINNKLYNTETATEIADWRNGPDKGDFRYVEETLYQKKNGEFFLYGFGGPLSKYGISWGSRGRCSDSVLIPFSDEETKNWLAEHSFADTYIDLFGEIDE